MKDYDDYLAGVLSTMGPEVARRTRRIASMLQDRWAMADCAAEAKAKVLVAVRCPDCRTTVARVYATDAGPLFESRIEPSKLDQLDAAIPPWITDQHLRELPKEAFAEDPQVMLTEYTRRNPPKMPYDTLSPPGEACVVMDLLEPPPSPPLGLWVRCKNHPRKPLRAEKRVAVIDHLTRYYPAGGTAVSRRALIHHAKLAEQSRHRQDYEVPRPSTP